MPELTALCDYLGSIIETFNGQAVLTVVSLGMGIAFYVADPRSPTSRCLALLFFGIGFSIALNSGFQPIYEREQVPRWTGISGVTDAISAIAGFEWILRIRRTLPSGNLKTGAGDNMLRVGELLVVYYAIMGFVEPTTKAHHFLGSFASPNTALTSKEFWLFALPMEAALTLGGISALLLLKRRPDVQESIRLVAFVVAMPFLASGLVLPDHLAAISTAVGLMIFLTGAIQYHIHQGRRGLFLSRFLSPQVVSMVRESGIDRALKDRNQEITVVSCDLRGFTAFSEATGSERVIQVLREYYDVVGEVVGGHGGTIKDYAGDGVLVLVGAPIAYDDHAKRALRMSREIVRRVGALTGRWSAGGPELGIGVGIASGPVTVGVIGGEGRMEYAAVGSAVNLASRLCENARGAEILVAERTKELLGLDEESLRSNGSLTLKGFGNDVPSFAV